MSNDETGGQRALVSLISAQVGMVQKKVHGSRSAVRVTWCLCHSKVRKATVFYLANKNNRASMDQAMSSEVAFAEFITELFRQDDVDIDRPTVMDSSYHYPLHTIDPNMCDNKNRKQENLVTGSRKHFCLGGGKKRNSGHYKGCLMHHHDQYYVYQIRSKSV